MPHSNCLRTVFLVSAFGSTLALGAPPALPGSAPDASTPSPVECKPGQLPVENCKGPSSLNEAIAQFDLEKAIGLTGRTARIRYLVLGAGAIIGQHSHRNRPCFEYLLEGHASETAQGEGGKVTLKDVKTGEGVASTNGIVHWWKNESTHTARIVAVDVFQDPGPKFCRCAEPTRTSPFIPPAKADDIKIEELGSIALGEQFPDLAAAKDYLMRSRRMTLLPGQTTKVQNSKGHPNYTYVVRGNVRENRSDIEPSARRPEECLIIDGNISYFWENPTSEPAVLWVVDFAKKGES